MYCSRYCTYSTAWWPWPGPGAGEARQRLTCCRSRHSFSPAQFPIPHTYLTYAYTTPGLLYSTVQYCAAAASLISFSYAAPVPPFPLLLLSSSPTTPLIHPRGYLSPRLGPSAWLLGSRRLRGGACWSLSLILSRRRLPRPRPLLFPWAFVPYHAPFLPLLPPLTASQLRSAKRKREPKPKPKLLIVIRQAEAWVPQ